jgi:predicted deacetylase
MLLASIHDVAPRFEGQVDALAERLARHTGPGGFAMLVVPDHWNQSPLAGNHAFAARLRGWADMGIEMFLHGWCHKDEAPATLAARHMTAGEGEFSGLTEAEARARLQRGRAVVEDAIGRAVAGFIAPAWLYSAGAHAALAAEGFALAEDHFRVWQPGSGRVLARGPVITWASRSPGRIRSSLLAAGMLRHVLKPWPVVRVAVHPGDTGVPALLESIDATLATITRRHPAGRYRDLLAG